MLRNNNMDMSADDFQRKLEREYHLDRADSLAPEYIKSAAEEMRKSWENVQKELSKYKK